MISLPVSDQKQAEPLLRAIVAASHEAVVAEDANGRVAAINQRFLELVNWSGDYTGQPLGRFGLIVVVPGFPIHRLWKSILPVAGQVRRRTTRSSCSPTPAKSSKRGFFRSQEPKEFGTGSGFSRSGEPRLWRG